MRIALGVQRLAIALVAVLVCAGIVAPSARLCASALLTAQRGPTSASQSVQKAAPSHRLQDKSARAEMELTVVETDDDEDGDGEGPRLDAAHGAPHALRYAPVPSKPDRVLRGALSIDTSRFTTGPCLARGPPVLDV